MHQAGKLLFRHLQALAHDPDLDAIAEVELVARGAVGASLPSATFPWARIAAGSRGVPRWGERELPELRNIRPRDAIAELERAGGVVRRSGKGDHVNIKMPNGQIITFSGRREPIKLGLLKAMLRKAGLSEDEFVALLEGEG